MRTLIAIPAMDRMYTITAQCLANIRPVGEYGTKFMIGMQVDMARNLLAKFAVKHGFDRILWLDSDMTFSPDIMERLSADLDAGWDVVSGIFFKRKLPMEPVVYKKLGTDGIETFGNYPQDEIFPVAGFGFGAVMMKTEVLFDLEDPPFDHLDGLGEDYSFCVRMQRKGRKIACDSRVKVGHIGLCVYGEPMYRQVSNV